MYIQVSLPIATYQTFIYRLNSLNVEPGDVIGKRVLVEFRGKKMYGIVFGLTQKIPKDIQIKEVIHIDDFPVFSRTDIEILKEISSYYVSPPGLTAYLFMPNRLKGKNVKEDLVGKIFILNQEAKEDSKLSKTQRMLLDLFNETEEISFVQLLEFGFSKRTVESLLRKGYIKQAVHQTGKIYHGIDIEKYTDERSYTSLGKGLYILSNIGFKERAEYYIDLFRKLKMEDKSVLIIFPSIMAGEKFYNFLVKHIDDVYLYNDSLSPKRQMDIWHRVREKSAIIVGTLSSLFVPLKNPGLVIIENENSESYRLFTTQRFDVKRIGYLMQRYKGIPVIFSDTLPSLESFLLLKERKAKPISVKSEGKHRVEIKGFDGFNHLEKELEKVITKSSSTLIVANRSYWAGFVNCERCGFEWLCENCNQPLRVVVRDKEKVLNCSLCNRTYPYSRHCPDCGNLLKEVGFGADKIFHTLNKTFFKEISKIEEEKQTTIKIASTLEGKLLLTKFETVINILPDFIKYLEDYRAEEKFFRNVLLPRYYTTHRYIIFSNILEKENLTYKILKGEIPLSSFYTQQVEFRRRYSYPPIVKFIKVEVFVKNGSSINKVREFFQSNFPSKEIVFQYTEDGYYKVILNSKNREVLKHFYERFGSRYRILIEVNTKQL